MRGIVASIAVFFGLLVSRSLGLAQQTTSAGTDDESLAVKENDPTGALTQFKVQDIYTPAQYGTNAQLNTLQIRPLLAVRPELFTALVLLIRPTIQVITVARNKGAQATTAFVYLQLLDLFVLP